MFHCLSCDTNLKIQSAGNEAMEPCSATLAMGVLITGQQAPLPVTAIGLPLLLPAGRRKLHKKYNDKKQNVAFRAVTYWLIYSFLYLLIHLFYVTPNKIGFKEIIWVTLSCYNK